MVIKEVMAQLESAIQPVTKILHKAENFKVIVIGFKNGMVLKEHKTTLPAKLTVLSGQVLYKQSDRSIELNKFDEIEIPLNIPHSVEAREDSICLLTQG
jgi:quercetin dioxygenase-like cupin family protein